MTLETIFPMPDLFAAKRILCIQPHYDDNDIGAAGILTQLARRGAEVIYLTVTDDLMGVVDVSLSDQEATQALRRDQIAAGKIVGVKEQYWLGYPDAGSYDYFALRRDLLKYLRLLRPDFVFTADPWLTYEAHRDHEQTGRAVAEAIGFMGLPKIASSDAEVDRAYREDRRRDPELGQGVKGIRGIAFYFTREPNYLADITATWEAKVAAVSCYQTQFDAPGLEEFIAALEKKSRQAAPPGKSGDKSTKSSRRVGRSGASGGEDALTPALSRRERGKFGGGESGVRGRGEPLKVLHRGALHCGL